MGLMKGQAGAGDGALGALGRPISKSPERAPGHRQLGMGGGRGLRASRRGGGWARRHLAAEGRSERP
jgi:hypothetical protein